MPKAVRHQRPCGLALARVLVVNDETAARLTLQTVLCAGGYHVDTATTSGEAIRRMESQEYELVLSHLHEETGAGNTAVLSHARQMVYQPATASVSTFVQTPIESGSGDSQAVLVSPEDLPELLGQVAEIIGQRARRQVRRSLAHCGN